jgi:hypothetical protein
MRAILLVISITVIGCSSATQTKVPHQVSWERTQFTAEFHSEGAHTGDFNGDGKMDLVSGPFWYEGPEFKTIHEYYEPEKIEKKGHSHCFEMFTDDFNSDGKTDILVISWPGKVSYWFENPGKTSDNKKHWKKHVTLAKVENESPIFADVNGDGVKDVVCSVGGTFGFYSYKKGEATKDWPFTKISTAKATGGRYTHGLGVGDVNGDGLMDVLEKGGWWEQTKSGLWTLHKFAFTHPKHGGAQMYAYDFDGDGDNDILTSLSAHEYGLAWFENKTVNGKITLTKHLIMGDLKENPLKGVCFSQLHAIDLVDMNGDGIKDFVTGKRHWAHSGGDPGAKDPSVLYWFETKREAGKVKFIPHLIDNNSGVGTQVIAIDINADKRPDVILGNKNGTFLMRQK